jgi:SpoVK/Ycf46/Vps4 family AAA+-type ATPase
MPGCGKSLVCKAISSAWNMPLLRLDFGRLFGSLVGKSEENARAAIKLAEAVAPSILWIDEIEKAISGISSSGSSDGGTTSRVLSTFLTWMQEKTSSVFVVATANDHSSIPPEFLRAGRFDEIFFVDLPNRDEREEIFKVLLRLRGLKSSDFNLNLLAGNSENYSGAEIEKGIDNAMLVGFIEKKRKINTEDIVNSLGRFKTLFEMRQSDFEELREWAGAQCIKANEEFQETISYGTDTTRKLDFNS